MGTRSISCGKKVTRRWFIALPLLAGLALIGGLIAWTGLPGLADQQGEFAAASILITDRHGHLLYEVIDPDSNKYVPLALDQTPLACRQATIATEDSRFYDHAGVDLIAIGRAAWQNWRGGGTVSGASTLTQQVARTLYLSAAERTERTLRRKAREAWLAWRLEQRHSKDEILALYLNTTYYGHFATGIEAASQAYFGIHAQELDLAQCALLAGLPQAPSTYNPVENLAAARNRQVTVLRLMVEQGYISAVEAQDARDESLAFASTPFPIAAPHFVMWVQGQLEALLPPGTVRQGGLRVTTTLDLDWQTVAEDAVQRRLAQLRPCADAAHATPGLTCDPQADPARRAGNAALISLDPATGAVLALVGSPDYFDPAISGAVNAALSPRQPGSAIKPLTYAAALNPARAAAAGQTPWTPATVIADLRTAFLTAEGEPYVPNNYDRVYHGPVTVRTALANSYNIPAVVTLDHIGIDALIEQAAQLGIPWRQEDGNSGQEAGKSKLEAEEQRPVSGVQYPRAASRFGLSLTLGGGEVRLLDLTAAYAAFANSGQSVTPYIIERVETLDGEILLDSSATQYAKRNTQSLDPRVAFLITDILSDNAARLPAFGAGNVLELNRPAAAKTGTTTDWRDNWTVGYTPELVTGVWVGNADNTPMKDVSGISGAGPIWRDFMLAVLRDLPPSNFEVPDGLVQIEVCADSGLLPLGAEELGGRGAGGQSLLPVPCPHRRLEWFIAGTEPAEVDRSHVRVMIDARTGEPANDATPGHYVVPQTIWQLPPEYQAWARTNQIPQLAVVMGQRSAIENQKSKIKNLQLTSPDPHRTYRIDPGLPLSAQAIPVTALPASDLGDEIVLLIDGAPFATAPGPDYTAWWPLVKGQHTFQAIAHRGDTGEVRSEEVVVFVE